MGRLISAFLSLVVLLAYAGVSVAQPPNDQQKGGQSKKGGPEKGKGKAPPKGENDPEDFKAAVRSMGAVEGPTVGRLGTMAEIKVPAGAMFLGQPGAAKFAEATRNLGGQKWLGVLFLGEAFVVFEFDESGYVKDADKEKLDADGLLSSMKEGEKASNEEMRRRGWREVHIDGWETPPAYDPVTNNLTWALRLKGEQNFTINHEIRILGRRGVMSATLVGTREDVKAELGNLNKALAGYEFTAGNKYAEWKPGDKVAAYGLAALVAGGGVALAAKAGLLAKFGAIFAKGGKVIIVAVVAVLAAIGKFFSNLFGRNRE